MDTNQNSPAEALRLDTSRMGYEVQRQAALYYHYSQEAADARKARDQAVRALDTRAAEVELNLRANPPGGKITEGGVKAHLEADPELNALRDAVINANHQMALLDGMCRALDHKKAQLDNAVRLMNNHTFQAGDGAADSADAAVRSHLNRNRQ